MKLPDGTTTTDRDLYEDTWVCLGFPAEQKFEGYKLYSFDPDFTYRTEDGDVIFPLEFCESLIEEKQNVQ